MTYTWSMAGFTYRKNLDGSAYVPALRRFGVKASTTYSVGDAIRINTSGTVSLAAAPSSGADNGIAGIVVQVVDANGLPITPDSGKLETWTIAASGTTTGYKVDFIPALPNYLFYNDSSGTLSAATLLMYADLSNEYQVNQSSLTDTATAQVRLIEIDPDHDADASKGLFQIVESQFGQLGVGNAA